MTSPYTLHPTPYTLHPSPYTLHPTPYTLHLAPYTLHPAPFTLHPTPYTLHPTPYTLHCKSNLEKTGRQAFLLMTTNAEPRPAITLSSSVLIWDLDFEVWGLGCGVSSEELVERAKLVQGLGFGNSSSGVQLFCKVERW